MATITDNEKQTRIIAFLGKLNESIEAKSKFSFTTMLEHFKVKWNNRCFVVRKILFDADLLRVGVNTFAYTQKGDELTIKQLSDFLFEKLEQKKNFMAEIDGESIEHAGENEMFEHEEDKIKRGVKTTITKVVEEDLSVILQKKHKEHEDQFTVYRNECLNLEIAIQQAKEKMKFHQERIEYIARILKDLPQASI